MNSVKETTMKQPELSKFADGMPLLPVRMLNEYVYCPRLAYLMWVQGEFAASADTVEGKIGHLRVDRPGAPLPEAKSGAATREGEGVAPQPAATTAGTEAAEKAETPETVHARSVWLGSERLAITGKVPISWRRRGTPPRPWTTSAASAPIRRAAPGIPNGCRSAPRGCFSGNTAL